MLYLEILGIVFIEIPLEETALGARMLEDILLSNIKIPFKSLPEFNRSIHFIIYKLDASVFFDSLNFYLFVFG